MNRRNPKAKWVLPDVVNPVGRRCVRVYVPDNEAHIAAFRGALLALQSAYNWADDEAHTAKDVALVWRDIIRDMGTDWGCGIESIEFRQPTNCSLEVRIDGGLWTPIYHGYNCALEAIADSIADGTIAAPSQQPSGGTVPANECHTYNITLRGNSRWHCPVPVAAGYSISVSNARGGWSDAGNILATWGCPDGTQYTLGQCGDALVTIPSDPLQSARHLRLIGYCNAVYMDMYNTNYIVPSGTPSSDFFLQANDGDLSGNDGEISLTVTVCNYSVFCHEFDFTASNGGWVADDSRTAVWVAGQGWRLKPVSANWGAKIYINTIAFTISEYELWYVNSGLSTTFSYMRGGNDGSVQLKSPALTGSPSLWQGSQSGTTGINLTLGGNMTDHLYDVMVSKIRIRGNGGDQWGGSNCT